MQITIDGENFELQRKKIRNLYLRLHPDGTAHVSAPMRMPAATIEAFLRSRIPWLQQQRTKLLKQNSVSDAQYIDGRTLFFFGQAYTLSVRQDAKAELQFSDGIAMLSCPENRDDARRAVILAAYANALRQYIDRRLPEFAARMGVHPAGYSLRYMRSRWGSCTPSSGTIRYNLRLAQKPAEWIDYVIVHELAHLRYADHSPQFWAFVERFAPNWRAIRKKMNEFEAI